MDNLTKLLQEEEGLALKAVKDSVGYVIGYGRNVMTKGVSREESSYLLGNDVRDVRAEAAARFPWYLSLPGAQQGVIEAMVFEMGAGGVASFVTMIANLKLGWYSSAATALLDSTFARQVPQRAGRLARQLRTGVWQYPAPGARHEPRFRPENASRGVRWTK
jgi:lysozyme